jgi:hypothetical protein
MPAVSVAQRQAAAIAEHHPEKATGAAKEMAKSMSKSQLHDFAATKDKGKPKHVKKSFFFSLGAKMASEKKGDMSSILGGAGHSVGNVIDTGVKRMSDLGGRIGEKVQTLASDSADAVKGYVNPKLKALSETWPVQGAGEAINSSNYSPKDIALMKQMFVAALAGAGGGAATGAVLGDKGKKGRSAARGALIGGGVAGLGAGAAGLPRWLK